MTGLLSLRLNNNQLTSLPSNIFSGLTGLLSLQLNNNQLTSLPSGIFSGLTNLQYLYLNNNQLTSLPSNIFSGLTSLQYLYLNYNQLTSLPSGLFSGLTSLQRVWIDNNQLTSLPSSIFSGLTNLQRLWVNGNPIGELDENIFEDLDSIQYLHLYNIGLSTVHKDLFDGLNTLRQLHLRNNQIASLHADTFDGLTSLQFLGLEVNRIRSLPTTIFSGPASSLFTLNLHNNDLSSIDRETFRGLGQLRTLRLYGNRIGNLPPEYFDGLGLSQLTTLHFGPIPPNDPTGGNGREPTSDEIASYRVYLPMLGTICGYNTGCPLTMAVEPGDAIPSPTPTATPVPQEATASCGSSPLNGRTQKVVDAIVAAIQLATPAVTACADATAVQLGNITYLSLEGLVPVRLASLQSGDFAGLTGLTTLELGDNHLSQLPAGVFDSLTDLTILRINGNRITSLDPNIFDQLSKLNTLQLNNNAITSLDANIFDQLSNLDTLWLHNNAITSLDANIFSRLTNLRILSLSGNRIEVLPQNLFNGLRNLKELYLDGNPLQHITPSYFTGQNLESLTHLILGNYVLTLSFGSITTVVMAVPSIEEFQAYKSTLPRLTALQLLPPYAPLRCGSQSPLDGRSRVVAEEILKQIDGVSRCQDATEQQLASVTVLDLSNKGLRSLQPSDFAGLSNLQEINLQNNPIIEHLPLSMFRGLRQVHTLKIGESSNAPQASQQHLASYQSVMPMLTTLLLPPNAPVPIPEPTPTQVPAPSDEPATILRIEPDIESISIRVGNKVRLSIRVFGIQNQRDDSLADDAGVTMEWISDGGGTFAESAPPGADPNGEPDDRKVLHTVPDTPGTYNVTARLDRPSECAGTEEQCSASIKIIATRSIEIAPSPTPVPCNISGNIPSAIADSKGVQYSVLTPTDGGTFTGDDGGEITASVNAVAGCAYIGIRIDKAGPADNANNPLYRYTLAGDIYSVSAVDSAGDEISDYSFDRPVQICVPLPPALRGNIADITALNINPDGSLTALTSKIISTPNGTPKVCGALGMLPAEIAAGKRGAPDPTFSPVPTATPEPPETGGRAVSYAWVLIAGILGIAMLMLGSATLRRRDTKN